METDFFKEKPEDSDPPSEFGLSSLQMDNNDIDYEDNDDYMKNYKKHYVNSSSEFEGLVHK